MVNYIVVCEKTIPWRKIMKNKLINIKRMFLNYQWIFIEIIINKSKLIQKITKNYYFYRKYIVIKEIEIGNISSNDNILMIGCGPYPYSAIALAQALKAKITIIDKNDKIVDLASSIINKYHLDPMIDIAQGDGLNFPVEIFDVIIIANTTWPIEEMLFHISKNAKPQSRIICREIKNEIEDILNNKLSNIFEIKSSFYHVKDKEYKSILLQKK